MVTTPEQMAKARAKRDVKEIAALILDKPMRKDDVVMDVDDAESIETLMTANTDVKTRIMMRMAGAAMNGDIKAAEFVMKYSGNEPIRETNVTVSLPTIIDDMADMDDDLKVTVKKRKKKVKPEEPPVQIIG